MVGDVEATPFGSSLSWRWQNPKPTGNQLLDVRFTSPATGWAVGEDDVLKTTDGGATWVHQEFGSHKGVRAVDFVDATHGWLAGDDILRTQDGGATWLPCGLDQYVLSNISSLSFADAMTGWAVDEGAAVLKTTDGGVTWTTVHSIGHVQPEAVDFVDAMNGWVACDDGKLAHTTDGGTTWVTTTIPLQNPVNGLTKLLFLSRELGWVAGDGAIFATTDAGKTWKRQVEGEGNISAVRFVDPAHGWASVDGNSPFDPCTILRTDDGGVTWTPITLGATGRLRSCWFTSADDGWVVGMSESGGCVLEATTDGGKTWSDRTSGLTDSLWDVSAASAQTAVAVGGRGLIMSTGDGGTTWVRRDSETTETLWSLSSASATETWAFGESGTIRHTADGGITWGPQSSGTSETLGSSSFIDPKHGWAAGENGTLLKTEDGGATWTRITIAPKSGLYNLDFVDASTGWLTTEDYTLLKTTDGGATWSPNGPYGGKNVNAVSFADADHGWVVGDDGEIHHTSDGGVTWTTQYARQMVYICGLKAIDVDTAVGFTNGGEILRTEDGGATWWLEVSPVQEGFWDVDFANRSVGWIVGAGGMILNTTDGGGAMPALATLRGTVYSAVTKKPLSGVAVSLRTYPTTHTDAAGRFTIPNIVPGYYDNISYYKPGYLVHGGVCGYFFDPGDVQDDDPLFLTEKTRAAITSASVSSRRLTVGGRLTPAHKAGVKVRFESLVGKKWVHRYDSVASASFSGRFSCARRLAKGTWRVQASVPAAKGYSASVSDWTVVRVK